MKVKSVLPQAVSVLVAVIVLIYIFGVPIGVADGGGQYKLLESLGLKYISAPSPDYFATQYGVFKNASAIDTPTAVALLAIGKSKEVFNVTSVAVIYGILLIIGLWLAVKGASREDGLDWAASALCVLVFADVGYTAYFNTLYSESAVLTTFILSVSLILLCHRKKAAPLYLIIPAVISSVAFSLCGTLQAWVGIIPGVLIVRLWALSEKRLCKAAAVAGGLVVIAVSVAFAFSYKPIDYEKNIFHSVFLGTAKHASVAELGLDLSLEDLAGSFYDESLNEKYNLKNEFFDKISYGKIFGFYSTHPVAFVKELNGAVKNAYTLRPSYLGNYTQSSGRAGDTANGFALYSTFKSRFVPNTFAFTAIFFVIYLCVLVYIYITEKEKRPIAEVLIGLLLSAAISLKLPLVLTGGFEIGRALYTFNIMFDSLIIAGLIAGGRYMLDRRKSLQSRYGASQ